MANGWEARQQEGSVVAGAAERAYIVSTSQRQREREEGKEGLGEGEEGRGEGKRERLSLLWTFEISKPAPNDTSLPKSSTA